MSIGQKCPRTNTSHPHKGSDSKSTHNLRTHISSPWPTSFAGVGGALLRVGGSDGRDIRRAVDSRAQVERKRNASATGAATIKVIQSNTS